MDPMDMTLAELLAYDRFCADLALYGGVDGEYDNLTGLFLPPDTDAPF